MVNCAFKCVALVEDPPMAVRAGGGIAGDEPWERWSWSEMYRWGWCWFWSEWYRIHASKVYSVLGSFRSEEGTVYAVAWLRITCVSCDGKNQMDSVRGKMIKSAGREDLSHHILRHWYMAVSVTVTKAHERMLHCWCSCSEKHVGWPTVIKSRTEAYRQWCRLCPYSRNYVYEKAIVPGRHLTWKSKASIAK